MENNSNQNTEAYEHNLQKEAEFWGKMAEERWKGGIPRTMDYQLATRYRVKRETLGWGDYIQDPNLENLTPFGTARSKFVQFVKTNPGKRALDLCCGAGWLALEMARAGKIVDAVDCSEREINVAKEYHSQLKQQPSGKINWIVADLNRYELIPNEYDLVTAWDALHHIPEIERLGIQILNSLKPGGCFLFCERVFGGEGRTFRTRISQALEIILNACLPLTWSYSKRFTSLRNMLNVIYKKYLLRHEVRSNNNHTEGHGFISPFEDSTGKQMLHIIENLFEIEKVYNFGAFSEEACRSLHLPRLFRLPTILFLSWFDYLWVKTGLLEGKLLIGYTRKRK